MKFGFIPTYAWPVEGSHREHVRNIVAQAELAAEVGFDSIWFPHSFLNAEYNRFQPLPMLGRLAAIDETLDLGVTYIITLEHPVSIAENLATLASLTDATLTLGALQGYVPEHFSAFGIRKRDRTKRFVEAIELLRRLWSENAVTFDGEFFQVENATVNPTVDIPIFIGANAEPSVRRAGRLGDGLVMSERTSIERGTVLMNRYREGLEASVRPSQGVAINRSTYVAETTDQAEAEVRPMMRSRVETYLGRGANDITEETRGIESQVDRMFKERLVGSPEECISRVRLLEAELGVDTILCMHGWREQDNDNLLESIRLFGEEVIPACSG